MSNMYKLLKLKDYITLIGTSLGLIALMVGSLGTRETLSFGYFLLSFCVGTDMIDGYVARKTGTVNEMGKELDSLSDSLTFGIAPAVLAFLSFRTDSLFDIILAIGCIVFAFGAILRLARFNLSLDTGYTGLPTPLSALCLIIYYFVNFFCALGLGGFSHPFPEISYYITAFILILLGWMNITTHIKFKEKSKYVYILMIIFGPLSPILAIVGSANPPPIASFIISIVLLIIFLGFMSWVLISSLVNAIKSRNKS